MSKVLVLKGSPRVNGNTDLLAASFLKGAQENGNEIKEVYLSNKNIHGCYACDVCRNNGGHCFQQDDMQEIYQEILDADVVAMVSPVYFYTWSAQMKAVIDRTYAIEHQVKDKTYYLITAGAAPAEDYFSTIVTSFEQYVKCLRGGNVKIGGVVLGTSTMAKGDVNGTAAVDKAYALGKEIH